MRGTFGTDTGLLLTCHPEPMTGESFLGQQGHDGIERRADPPPSRQEILAMMNERLELLTAIAAGMDRRSELIAAVGEASDRDGARRAVMDLLGVTEMGADAVLAMQVRRFSVQERKNIRLEQSQIEEERRKLES
ncbi:hypothetical protein [Rhodococcus sp. PvP104]|uniref:hypothetical protein n=1 Tax=Rhodococcus sp. PvP104 TaxID=2817911 RepID=UPI001AE53F2D|nr:hypothetical protein [Rhodococcus sp. PvP104]MBP2527262.1 hypothetical protein [Rhodococcus sp. PvP104]